MQVMSIKDLLEGIRDKQDRTEQNVMDLYDSLKGIKASHREESKSSQARLSPKQRRVSPDDIKSKGVRNFINITLTSPHLTKQPSMSIEPPTRNTDCQYVTRTGTSRDLKAIYSLD